METRTYNGHTYQRSAPGQPWTLVGGAPAVGQIISDPYAAQEQGRKNEDQEFERKRLAADQARLQITQAQDSRNAATQPYDVATAAANTVRARDTAVNAPGDRSFDRAKALRNDYFALPSVKSYTQALPVYAAGLRSGPDSAGDLNLIYAYAKVMDPNSVVREGEQASVASGDTWINQKTAELQKQLGNGGTFQPAFRQRLRQEMAGRMAQLNESFIADRVNFKHNAERNGVNPLDVVGDHPGNRFQALEAKTFGRDVPKLDYDGMPLATGGTKTQRNPELETLGADLIRGGLPYEQVNKILRQAGASGDISREQFDTMRSAIAQGYQGRTTDTAQEVPTSLLNRVAASPAGAVGLSAIDAGMAGTTDELSGLINAAINGRSVSDNIAEMDAGKQALFAENPKSAMAGQVGGSIASMIGVGKLMEGIPLAMKLSNPGLAADLTFGTLSGAGQNNDNRLVGSAAGAAGGAVGNAAGALIAKPIGALARTQAGVKGVNVARALVGRVPGVEPRAPITGAAAPSAAEQAILSTAERAGIPEITGTLADAQAQNLPFSLADTAPSLAELGGAATRRSPIARNLAESILTPRNRGQIERLGSKVETELGPIGNTLQISDDLVSRARADAAPLYAQAYATPVPDTPEIASLLSTPFGRQGLGRARTIIANERGSPTELGFALDADGNTVLNPRPNDLIAKNLAARAELDDAQAAYRAAKDQPGSMDSARARLENARQRLRETQGAVDVAPDPSAAASVPAYTTQTLDYVKRGMDDVLEQHRNPVTNRLVLNEAGRAENDVKNQMLREVDRLNEPFRQARQAYQGPMESRDALFRGQDFYGSSVDANQIAASVADQTPEHLAQMQLGYRDELMSKANDLRYSSNPWQTLNSPGAEQKLSAMYPDTPGVANLLASRDGEIRMAATANRMIGGSPTAPRMIADQQFMPSAGASAVIDAATAATGGVPIASVTRALVGSKLGDTLRLGVGRKAEKKAEEMLPQLLNIDPAASQAILDDLIAKAAQFDAFKQATTPNSSLSRLGASVGQNRAVRAVR